MTLDEYIRIVADQIRAKGIRTYVERELHDHIVDEYEQIIRDGETDPERAMDRAIMQMGDPIEVGERLNKAHRLNVPWKGLAGLAVLLPITIPIVCGLSLLTEDIAMHDVLQLQVAHVAMVFAAAVMICAIDYSKIAKWSEPAVVTILALMLVASVQIYWRVCTYWT